MTFKTLEKGLRNIRSGCCKSILLTPAALNASRCKATEFPKRASAGNTRVFVENSHNPKHAISTTNLRLSTPSSQVTSSTRRDGEQNVHITVPFDPGDHWSGSGAEKECGLGWMLGWKFGCRWVLPLAREFLCVPWAIPFSTMKLDDF